MGTVAPETFSAAMRPEGVSLYPLVCGSLAMPAAVRCVRLYLGDLDLSVRLDLGNDHVLGRLRGPNADSAQWPPVRQEPGRHPSRTRRPRMDRNGCAPRAGTGPRGSPRRTEYEVVVDSIVVAQQVGTITCEQAAVLSELIGRYERRRPSR